MIAGNASGLGPPKSGEVSTLHTWNWYHELPYLKSLQIAVDSTFSYLCPKPCSVLHACSIGRGVQYALVRKKFFDVAFWEGTVKHLQSSTASKGASILEANIKKPSISAKLKFHLTIRTDYKKDSQRSTINNQQLIWSKNISPWRLQQ